MKETEISGVSKTSSSGGHWSQQKEKAAGYWLVKFTLILFRILPVVILRIVAFPVGFFYFIFSGSARKESYHFLQTAAPFINEPKTAQRCRSRFGPLRHIISFSLTLVEKIQSWGGKFTFKKIHFYDDDAAELKQNLENGKGACLITSHLGNMELLRGLAAFGRTGVSKKVSVTAIEDVAVTAHFNRMLKDLNPESGVDLISVKDISPDTAIILEEKLASGELFAIAGDRTAEGKLDNYTIQFFGKDAHFSSGPFYLAALMKAPVYFVFGVRRNDLSLAPQYDMHIIKSNIQLDCSRKERFERCYQLASSFAALLENYCKEHPFQWYNFYDFWYKGA
jgi:predicted LPLAT superfamily acyltransferase